MVGALKHHCGEGRTKNGASPKPVLPVLSSLKAVLRESVLGENCDNLLKCILEAFGIMVKRGRLQSDNLAFLPNCWVALDKCPPVTEAPCRLG